MKCKEKCMKNNNPCIKSDCRNWIAYEDDLNCVLVCAEKNGPLTLQETSKRIGVSYVRIKQIQDKALAKMQISSKEDSYQKERYRVKSYNIKIKDKKNREKKSFTVSVDSEDDFVKWMEILSNFEKQEKISYEEVNPTSKQKEF